MNLAFAVFAFLAIVHARFFSVVVHDASLHQVKLVDGYDEMNGVAWASYQQTSNQTGWDILEISTNASATDYLQAFSAGYIEGAITQSSIWNSWLNYANGTTYEISSELKNFVLTNDQWYRNMTQQATENIEYWKQVSLVLVQTDAILAGYNDYAPDSQQLTYLDWLLYQLNWDLGDFETAVSVRKNKDAPKEKHHDFNLRYDQESMLGSHCSVLVKPSADGSNLFSSHVTWTGFSTMLRTWKYYYLPYSLQSTQSVGVSFSSYPGNIVSGDDFYITTSDLTVVETTNGVMNNTLYELYVTEQTVPYWIRITVANRMANGGSDWAKYFALYNSGSYNNQWIITDNKLFTPGQPLVDGTLWIAEQIPGYLINADETDVLRTKGYWASYNIPFFPFVYNISGYPEMYEKYGNMYSYSECARAQIFRRDQSKVATFSDMQRIMRYNQWQTDPLALQDACRGISARCDLNPPWVKNSLNGWVAFGATDAKITDNFMTKTMTCKAVSGPTWDSQPPFAWTNEWNNVPHFGQPQIFAFQFETMSPQEFVLKSQK